MSSEEEYGGIDKGKLQTKRKRMYGACDLCRQKKIRCDSAKRQGSKCSNCVASDSACTHVYLSQKIGPGYRSSRKGLSASSSESLSLAQLRGSMDALLKTILHPTYQAPTNPAIVRETLVNLARYTRALEAVVPNQALSDQISVMPPPQVSSSTSPSTSPKSAAVSSKNGLIECLEDEVVCALMDSLKRSLVLTDSRERFFGPSSNISLVTIAIELSGHDPSRFPVVSRAGMAQYMRPHFWSVLPWECAPPPDHTPYHFPTPDLMDDLVDRYFVYVNNYKPLLHRPTFERGIKAGLHISDPGFGGTVLGVCALGSRYSDDRRVLLDGTNSLHSCGFTWFRQMRFFHESSLRVPSLHELQTLCLAVLYLQGSSTPEKCWYLVGFGIRAAQDVGLNRRRKDETEPTIEGELRKRVFWTLLLEEMSKSTIVGRSPSISLADFDVELPVACDDEYWENCDPALAFKQPSGKPSKISFFNCLLSLLQIHCFADRFFYSVKRSVPPPGIAAEEWDRVTLANIDSVLNAWFESIPEHLRWDPRPSDPVFFNQSAILFTSFYYAQILLHRPFISKKDQPVSTSLAICTNAARTCIRIMETQSQKGFAPAPQLQVALFGSGLVLLLSIWKKRDMGLSLMDESKELIAVVSCIKILRVYETRWHLSGRFCDFLMALLATKGMSLPPNFISDLPETPIRQQPTVSERGKGYLTANLDMMNPPSLAQHPLYPHPLESRAPSELRIDELFESSQKDPLNDLVLQQQLDELEAILGTSASAPMQQISDQQSRFFQPPPVTVPDPAAAFLPASSAPPPRGLSFLSENATNSLLDLRGPVMWAGVSAGHQWDDLIQYIGAIDRVPGSAFAGAVDQQQGLSAPSNQIGDPGLWYDW